MRSLWERGRLARGLSQWLYNKKLKYYKFPLYFRIYLLLKQERNETVTNCNALKLRAADGKMRLTDVADTEQLFRIIQSIPSPKAEPFKQWMAHVAADRIYQLQAPELSIQQAMMDYKWLGYSDNWINQRLKSIEIRKDLIDQRGISVKHAGSTLNYKYNKIQESPNVRG